MKTYTDENEPVLIARARNGDREAYAALVRSHYARVIQLVFRVCGDLQMAEDAAQESFLKAWQSLGSYQPRSPFRNWLYRISMNVTLDRLRKEQRVVYPGVEEKDFPDSKPGPEELYIKKEKAMAIQAAIHSLPPASRAALVLRELEGMSYHEIADTLNIPAGTVMSRLNYARERLRELLKEELTTVEVNHA